MKFWKRKEQQFVDWLNQIKIPWTAIRRSRGLRGEGVEDIEFGELSVELKTGKKLVPGYILDWITQAKTNCEGRIPIVIAHSDGMKKGKQIVMIEYEYFERLLETLIGE